MLKTCPTYEPYLPKPSHGRPMRSRVADVSRAWMPMRGSLLRRFFGVFGVDAILKASGVIFLPVYLSLMTQEAYGSFSYIASLIGVLSLVCNFGLYVAQSKLLHEFPRRQRDKTVFTINILLAVLLLAALLPMYALGGDRMIIRFLFSGTVKYEEYRSLIPIGIVLAIYSQMLLNFFLTQEQVRNVQRYNVSRLLLGLLLTIGALYALSGDGAAIRMLALFFAEFVALCAFFPNYARAMQGRFSTRIALKSLSLGLPIMGSAVLGVVINFGDKFFIERYCSLAEMSVYFLGLTLASAVSVVSMAFQNVWLPSFLKERNLAVNLERTRRAGRHLLVALTLLSAVIWVGVALCFLFDIFKREYAPVLTILPILLASSVASGITALLSAYTIYWNMTFVTVVVGTIVAACSIPLNYFTVRAYGTYGAASTSLLVNVLFATIYLGFMRYRMNLLGAASN
jgi:O-antigen/teichoic acid export membrane protein